MLYNKQIYTICQLQFLKIIKNKKSDKNDTVLIKEQLYYSVFLIWNNGGKEEISKFSNAGGKNCHL